jgi:hypothetical protein
MDRMGALYVVSDVHGYREDLVRGLDRAGFSGGDELWILGDLLDRGPDGIGVIDLAMSLQEQAPGQVHVLMGNHEALALGRHRFPGTKLEDSWRVNGGKARDQEGLTERHLDWLGSLPLMARVGDYLLVHSDTTEYLSWGKTIDDVNSTVASALAEAGDLEAHWDVWARLTSRYDYARRDGGEVAREVLDTYGGEVVIHGHSIIGTLLDRPSREIDQPLLYADGLVLDIDGGRYDGGPLLIVRLD